MRKRKIKLEQLIIGLTMLALGISFTSNGESLMGGFGIVLAILNFISAFN